MKPLSLLLFCAALNLRADVAATLVRLPGASLDASLQNEADHALSQATLWLDAQQHPDGSWGESNRVRLTSIALFSLKGSRQPSHAEACARAALWLGGSVSNRIDDLGTHAWRLLAIAIMLPEEPSRTNLLRRLADQGEALETGASAGARTFWREALAAAGLGRPPPPDGDVSSRLTQAAAAWPPSLSDNAGAWRLARLINRAGNGQLLCGDAPLDWRTDLARHLINTQRRAPAGGFWKAPTSDGQIEETALGILVLLEL